MIGYAYFHISVVHIKEKRIWTIDVGMNYFWFRYCTFITAQRDVFTETEINRNILFCINFLPLWCEVNISPKKIPNESVAHRRTATHLFDTERLPIEPGRPESEVGLSEWSSFRCKGSHLCGKYWQSIRGNYMFFIYNRIGLEIGFRW